MKSENALYVHRSGRGWVLPSTTRRSNPMARADGPVAPGHSDLLTLYALAGWMHVADH